MTRVVVVGRDAALWLACMALRRALAPAGVTVEAVELPTALAPCAVYATLPPLEALHAQLGVEEADLLRSTGGTFSFGQNICGPGREPFFLGWGTHGQKVEGGPFFSHWLRAGRQGDGAPLSEYSLAAVAALGGRMVLPDDETEAFGRADYGYHLPARSYVSVLKSAAPRLGVTLHQALTVEVERAGGDGAIAAVQLDGGRRIAGDLFVDATGAEALLIGALDPAGRRSWRGAYPADRRLVARGPALRTLPPYADVRVGEAGWLKLCPTRGDTRVEFVFADADLNGDQLSQAVGALARMPLADASLEQLAPGARERGWVANCVAIGASAAAFDPFGAVELQWVQLGIVHLLSLFPAGETVAPAERDEFNRITRSALERLRQFQSALYALSPWPGAFWQRGRAAQASPDLAHRIEIFRARGEVAPFEDETFLADTWQALLIGLGARPDSWPPSADVAPIGRVRDALWLMRGFVLDAAARQPTHDAYLAQAVGQGR